MSLLNRFNALPYILAAGLCVAAGADSAQAWTTKVCIGSASCSAGSGNTFNSIQAAFDYSTSGGRHDDPAWIYVQPGLHKSAGTRLFQHSDWRRANCASRSAHAGFLLSGRTATTHIQGTSVVFGELIPQDTILWGKIPASLISGHGQFPNIARFHGLAIVNNVAPVFLANLSVVADGGYTANGAGDASLYVLNSEAHLEDAVVSGNKGASNCLRSPNPLFTTVIGSGTRPVYHDQEGILVDGPASELVVKRSAVGGNIHTGIMALGGARAEVDGSVVRGNGWDSGHFQNEEKGHGVTSWAACYSSNNNEIDVHNSLVTHNTGHGVLLRGSFAGTTQDISYNDLMANGNSGSPGGDQRYGVAIQDSSLASARVRVLHNDYANDPQTILGQNVTCTGSNSRLDLSEPNADLFNVACPVYQTGTSHPGASDQSTIRWSRLLAVHSQMMAQPAGYCPSF